LEFGLKICETLRANSVRVIFCGVSFLNGARHLILHEFYPTKGAMVVIPVRTGGCISLLYEGLTFQEAFLAG
jgi:hypothetical protein